MKEIQKAFLWNKSTPEIKYEPHCNDYKDGELKNVKFPNNIIAPQNKSLRSFFP